VRQPPELKEFDFRNGLVTAQRDIPKSPAGLHYTRLTGLGVTGWPCKRGPVDAATARYIAENTPGGAYIVWEGGDKSFDFAHVYSRTLVYQP
jgi:hypothetical protein